MSKPPSFYFFLSLLPKPLATSAVRSFRVALGFPPCLGSPHPPSLSTHTHQSLARPSSSSTHFRFHQVEHTQPLTSLPDSEEADEQVLSLLNQGSWIIRLLIGGCLVQIDVFHHQRYFSGPCKSQGSVSFLHTSIGSEFTSEITGTNPALVLGPDFRNYLQLCAFPSTNNYNVLHLWDSCASQKRCCYPTGRMCLTQGS